MLLGLIVVLRVWISTSPQVMVVTSEGLFYSYAIDLESGGECVLQKSYSLLDGNDTECVVSNILWFE